MRVAIAQRLLVLSEQAAGLAYESKEGDKEALLGSLGAYPFTRSLADRGIALCGSILRVMTRIRCPLA
jgi:hypothetical protein